MKTLRTRLKSEWLWLGGALALTALVYLPVVSFPFVYDDLPQIVGNPYITAWHNLPAYFGAELWRKGWSSGVYYRPVMMLWFLLNRMLFGLHVQLWHLASIALHVAVTFLLYKLALRLTGSSRTSILTAVIFGVHPVHIESVVWLSGIPDPLAALFLLLAMLSCIKYREAKHIAFLAAAVFAYTAALLAKEVGLVFPAIVFAYVLCSRAPNPGGDSSSEDGDNDSRGLGSKLREAALLASPYLSLAIFYVGVRSFLLQGFASISNLPPSVIGFTAPSVLAFYLRHLVWPYRLSLFYDSYYVTTPSLADFWLPLLLLLAVIVALWMLSRRCDFSALAFSSWWLLLTLLPVLNFRAFHWRELVHDRYLYLPSMGFAIIIAVLVDRLASRFRIAATAALTCALVTGTLMQLAPWGSPLLLYYNAVQVAPNHIAAVTLLAGELKQHGASDQAEQLYSRATRLAPNWSEAWYDLAEVQNERQEYAAAESSALRATQLDSNNAAAFYLLGVARIQTRQWSGAADALRAAVALQPGQPDFRRALDFALNHLGNATNPAPPDSSEKKPK